MIKDNKYLPQCSENSIMIGDSISWDLSPRHAPKNPPFCTTLTTLQIADNGVGPEKSDDFHRFALNRTSDAKNDALDVFIRSCLQDKCQLQQFCACTGQSQCATNILCCDKVIIDRFWWNPFTLQAKWNGVKHLNFTFFSKPSTWSRLKHEPHRDYVQILWCNSFNRWLCLIWASTIWTIFIC